MRNIKQEFIRYLGVGGISFIADFTMLALLATLFGVNYLIATLMAFLLGTWTNYTLSLRWVFNYRNVANQYTEFSIFILVGVLTLGLSIAFMSMLVGWFGIHLLLAKCITTGLTLVANFAGRRLLLFRETPHSGQATSTVMPAP